MVAAPVGLGPVTGDPEDEPHARTVDNAFWLAPAAGAGIT